MNAPTKQVPAPGPIRDHEPPIARPSVGRIVHFYDSERPGEFNNIGKGPYAAIVVQVWKDQAKGPGSGEVLLECGLYVLSDQGGQNHFKVVHASQREETRARRYWEWPKRDA